MLIGGSALYRFQSNLGLGLEVNWVQKGGRGDVQGASWDLDLDYVEIPLTAHLVVGLGERWDWNLYGGIALAFRTTCDVAGIEGEKEPCETGAPEFVIEDSEWRILRMYGIESSHRFMELGPNGKKIIFCLRKTT